MALRLTRPRADHSGAGHRRDPAQHRRGHGFGRARTLLIGTALAGLAASAAIGAPTGDTQEPGRAAAGSATAPAPASPPGAVELLRADIEAMLDRGLPADHPKVELLQAEVDALMAVADREPVPEEGVELRSGRPGGTPASSPQEAARIADEVRPAQPAERGVVACEPIPRQLGPDEIAGATCLSVPQGDGSSRYVAVEPSGDVHVVHFGPDRVERLADRRLPVGRRPGGVELVPDGDGTVRLMSGGDRVGSLDVE